MLFPENDLFAYVLVDLADEIASHPVAAINPLPCDRWIARSALQKAIRRAEPKIAIRALANLYQQDSRSVWRHLVIIALEDVGIANVDILARIVAARQDRAWRNRMGGDWPVLAELVHQMAVSLHWQAACDMLLKVLNDPSIGQERDDAIDADIDDLIARLVDGDAPILSRGIAALAVGGGLIDGQTGRDPMAVFEAFADMGHFSHVVATCHTAWKISRNPMALLLPLIWQAKPGYDFTVADDTLPAVQLTSGVPGYALDQFTRRGNAVSRTLLAESDDLRSLLDLANVRRGDQVLTVGDLIFLIEGGRVRNRSIWSIGDELRLPHRHLPAVPRLGPLIDQALLLVDAHDSQIAKLRHEHLSLDYLE